MSFIIKSGCDLIFANLKDDSQHAYLKGFADQVDFFSLIDVNIHLRRRSLFHTFNFVLPSLFITILSISGFILPPESGEKVGLRMLKSFL